MSMEVEEAVRALKELADYNNVVGMQRYGISPDGVLGVAIPQLHALAKRAGTDHVLALGLWATGIHEARILAAFVGDPELLTEGEMEEWAADFDSWDVVDQVCNKLFWRSRLAWVKAEEWAGRPEEFVKRAGFVLMTQLAVHDKRAADAYFLPFLETVEREATDKRNFVKKAVNWALRQIGKRDPALNAAAVAVAARLRESDSAPARWVGSDALRELQSEAVRARLGIA